ncbi:mitochondrial inner membrane protease ATP23 homolog isoform X2 [Dromiciops gliroides]|uniref:mitochondrial inner membrane protease ATP23 homolog isoform X2 n=1 Tax=Dromiciops gliroides TaxID=33562 RepID=UPI001CC7C7B2|nr:mitochondrial inner membrane protease ATP23 homolog isoform X2 [Dromiciops gliroides]
MEGEGAGAEPQREREREREQQQQFTYQVFPERFAEGKPKRSFLATSFFTHNQKCQLMLLKAVDRSPYVKLLLDAMKRSGCTISRERHFSCEDCNGNVSGGFDSATSQIVLCQNNIHNQAHMNRVVTHELIHAFDHCRAHVDWFTNVKHLACSETCVRDRALRSILAVRKVSKEDAQKAVDEVFESCFNDHEPFGRIPHSKSDAKHAHRDFQNRDRYYANV